MSFSNMSYIQDPNQKKRVVGCDSVGVRSKATDECQTLIFIIHDFEKFEKDGKRRTKSRPLKAHGCNWRIECVPHDDDGQKVGVYLYNLENFPVTALYTIRCKNRTLATDKGEFVGNDGWGRTLIQRSNLHYHLECDGSLAIAVDIKMFDSVLIKKVWYPKRLQRQHILVDLYEDSSSETADVLFSVKGNEYRAHKSILALRCKKLFEIAKAGSDDDKPIPIFIEREELFRWLLEFVYTVELPKLKEAKDAMDLLVVADQYECIPLKLYIESVIVDRLITPENTAKMFLFADQYSCALLREKAITIFVDDTVTVRKAKAWSEITESKALVLEFLDALSFGYQRQADVTTLREQLEKAKLPLDGSRKILEERWNAFCRDEAKTAKEKAQN